MKGKARRVYTDFERFAQSLGPFYIWVRGIPMRFHDREEAIEVATGLSRFAAIGVLEIHDRLGVSAIIG